MLEYIQEIIRERKYDMNKFEVLGHITDPKNFNRFGDDAEPGLFATVVMNKYKGKDADGKAINEPVFVNFAAYGSTAKRLNDLEKGARILVVLSPYNKVKANGEGKKITTLEWTCKNMTIIDWTSQGKDGK